MWPARGGQTRCRSSSERVPEFRGHATLVTNYELRVESRTERRQVPLSTSMHLMRILTAL